MADQGTSTSGSAQQPTLDKGKGRATEDVSMDEEEESSEEESGVEEQAAEAEGEDEDNMEEIDTENIVKSRTRGKEIDFQQAAKDAGPDEDEDDEDDGDFEAPAEDDAMEE